MRIKTISAQVAIPSGKLIPGETDLSDIRVNGLTISALLDDGEDVNAAAHTLAGEIARVVGSLLETSSEQE